MTTDAPDHLVPDREVATIGRLLDTVSGKPEGLKLADVAG